MAGRARAGGEKVRVAAARAQERSVRVYEEARSRRPSVDIASRAYERFTEAKGFVLAAHLAYRMFLLFLPLVVIIVSLAGIDPARAAKTSDDLRLGQTIARAIAQAGGDAANSSGGLLITGIVGFVIAAWSLTGALQFTAAQAWRVSLKTYPGKGAAFGQIALSLVLIGFVVYLSTLLRSRGVVGGLAGALVTAGSWFVMYFGLGWILPRRSKEWFWLLPGAFLGVAASLGFQAFATFYLPGKLADASATYGTFGIVLTLLSYLYFLGALLTVGPVLNSVVWERYEDDVPGLLRRVAAKIPFPETSIGSGYVGHDAAVVPGSWLPGWPVESADPEERD